MLDDRAGMASRLSRDGTAHMVAATGIAALGAYLFQVLGGRVLGPVQFAPITVLWTIQFLVFTILLFPIEQFATRHLALSGGAGLPTRTLRSVAGLVAVTALGTALFIYATRDRLFLGEPAYALVGAGIVIGYGLFALGRGFLAGRRRFRAYGLVTGAESSSRLVLAALLLWAVTSGLSLSWSMMAAPLVVLAWWPFRASDEGGGGGLGRFLAGYVPASAASQTILAGGPLAVGALGAGPAEVSIFFVTFTLFRGPLTMAYSLIARVLPPFTILVAEGAREQIRRWSVRLVLAGTGLGVLGGMAGFLAGPEVVALLFGGEFRPAPVLAALAVAGVGFGALAMVGNQMLVAMDQTHRLAVAWTAALAVAALVLFLTQGSASLRTGVAFVAGEAAALLLVMGAIWLRPGR